MKEYERCSYPECDNIGNRKTLCQGHYVMLKRNGELRPLRKTTRTKTFEQQIEEYKASLTRKPPAVLGKCRLDFCERQAKIVKDNLCKAHYQQQYRGVEFSQIRSTSERQGAETPVRKCNTCCRLKSKTEFYDRTNGRPQPECKHCVKMRARLNFLIAANRLDEARSVQASWVAYASQNNKEWATTPKKLTERI